MSLFSLNTLYNGTQPTHEDKSFKSSERQSDWSVVSHSSSSSLNLNCDVELPENINYDSALLFHVTQQIIDN